MSLTNPSNFRKSRAERQEIWQVTLDQIEQFYQNLPDLPVTPPLDPQAIRAELSRFTFESPLDPHEVIGAVCDGLTRWQVHTPHSGYFGLFNPAPSTMGIVADQLVAAFNPQLAAWSHSPFANEVERHLVHAIGSRFGYKAPYLDGTFCSGGAEANHTAVLAALVHTFPAFSEQGVQARAGQPVFYVSRQSHHSFVKAARFCGLGTRSVREIDHDRDYKMDMNALKAQIEKDRQSGYLPFLLVATAGTTSGGIIDPVEPMSELARQYGLWLHVDSAWGGAAAFVPELKPHLGPIHRADSITFDCHKWMSVPMGAGLFLTLHPEILNKTCHMATEYMPRDGRGLDVVDPYTHSLQWSRRFIGLKVFMTLAQSGWAGYESTIRHQAEMGVLLKAKLVQAGWQVVNDTPLPVVCFHSGDPQQSFQIAQAVNEGGSSWISGTYLDPEIPVIRACITNFETQPEDLDRLITALDKARNSL